jgi:hypothetical protein
MKTTHSRKKNTSQILLLLGICWSILTANGSNALGWNISTIDIIEGVGGKYNSIAIDSNSKAHISYYYLPTGDLKYATNASGVWQTVTIDSSGITTGLYASIATDSNNAIHISYGDASVPALKYATNASGEWVTSIIGGAGWGGGVTSIAIDSNNKAHISYMDDTNIDLKYATNASGSWETFTVDSTGDLAPGVSPRSIAVDSNDKVHINYYDATNGHLKYATNASGSWETLTIDSAGDVGWISSIAVDSNNKVHIACYDEASLNLKYATNVSGSWETFTIASTGDAGPSVSIAVDSNNKIHISYLDDTNLDLKYALEYTNNVSGLWEATTIDSAGDAGWYNSIAIDSNNKVHISYYDRFNADLKYATNASGLAAPDLIETAVSDPPSSSTAGSSFSVTDSVMNQGSASAGASITSYYLSLDTTKGNGDILLTGSRSVPSLGINGTNDGISTVTIPSSTAAGSYFLLACADDSNAVGESDENNNCIASASKVSVISISVTSPNGGESLPSGTTQTIRWSYTGSPGAYLKIELLKGGVLNKVITSLARTSARSFNWRLPVTLTPGADYSIRITSRRNPFFTDTSDRNFTVVAPSLTLTSPNGGETWAPGTTQTIRWTFTGGPGTYLKIELLKGEVLNRTITRLALTTRGSFNWRIPALQVPGADYSIRITSRTIPSCTDVTDLVFTIGQ